MLVDVVLLPPKKVSRQLGGIGAGLNKKYSLKFAVDGRKLLPHLSLYHLRVNDKRLKDLERKLEALTKNSKPIRLGIGAPQSGKFYFVLKTTKPKALSALHKRVLEACEPLRVGHIPWLFKLSAADKKLYKKYGSPIVLKNFSPHFTLGWAKAAKDLDPILKDLKKLKRGLKNFKADRLAIGAVNKYFQVTKIIKEFKLL